MAQEVVMAKSEEFNRLVLHFTRVKYQTMLHCRIAAETHLLFQDKIILDAIVNARVKELKGKRENLTKRLREVPGVASVAGGQSPPDVYEDGMLANGTLDNLLKQVIKNTTKRPRQAVATPSNAVLQELKESGDKPKKKQTPTQTPVI